jgi:hypothetical protein
MILERILSHYSESRDYNGIALTTLQRETGLGDSEIRSTLAELVRTDKATLAFARESVNPHIKRFPDPPTARQLELLATEPIGSICAYPSISVLQSSVSPEAFRDEPYTRRLALGEPQLAQVFFELKVLEQYQRDPRYSFEFGDFSGRISIASPFYESGEVRERDKVLLDTFGIGYDSKMRRVIVTFLRYLSNLSPQHQQIWRAHEIDDEPCRVNADYLRASYDGDWPRYRSAYQAFLEERRQLNRLAELIGKPPLFRDEWVDQRPPGFHPMLRPTKQHLSEYVHLLDKLLSENINRDFFQGDIALERRVERPDGSFDVDRPGTLKLLEEWLSTRYKDANGEDVAREVLRPLREIRTIRQKPAHAIEGNEYDERYTQEQDRLLGEATRALTKLRYILWSHPDAKDRYSPPDWLDSDRIVFY